MSPPLLKVEAISKSFPLRAGVLGRVKHHLQAVDQISLTVEANQTLGLVGESGSGKSTLARLILHLIQPTAGKVWFEGQPLHDISYKERLRRRKGLQMIFQDPLDSLNARWTIGQLVAEPLLIEKGHSRQKIDYEVDQALERVGLPSQNKHRYPHELSGGQRQRVGIARALIMGPRLILADEPVSALDVSVQAQILNLLQELQADMGVSFLFIAHDIHVIRFMSDRIAVMYMGKIVEIGSQEEVTNNPKHPYTVGLWASVPSLDPQPQEVQVIKGEIPSLIHIPMGCAFHPRCPVAQESCKSFTPVLQNIAEDHQVACPVAVV